MKSLDQLEPRTPLAGGSTPIAIHDSGSYYLTGPLTVSGNVVGISILAADVTLDLGGFTVKNNSSGQGIGINITGQHATIRNGVIRSFGSGITSSSTQVATVSAVQFNTLVAAGGYAVTLGTGSVIEGCVAYNCGGAGIFRISSRGLIQDCLVVACNGFTGGDFKGIGGGIGIKVKNCLVTGFSSPSATTAGISLGAEGMVEGCAVTSASSSGSTYHLGVEAGNNSSVSNTLVASLNCFSTATVRGFSIGSGSSVKNCTVSVAQAGGQLYGFSVGAGSNLVGSTVFACSSTESQTAIFAEAGSTVEQCAVSYCASSATFYGIQCSNGHIRNCRIFLLTGAAGKTCIGINAGLYALVEGCSLEQIPGIGIRVEGGSTVSRNVVADATSENPRMGIQLFGNGNTVEGNTLTNTDMGIQISSGASSVKGNTISGCATGIEAVAAGQNVSANSLIACTTGLRLQGESNRVEGNHLSATNTGIYLDAQYNHVSGNTLDSGSTGLRMDGAANTAEGNTITDFSTAILLGGARNRVLKNSISNGGTYGIRTSDSTANYNLLLENTITSCGEGIFLASAFNTVTGNHLILCTTGLKCTMTLTHINRNTLRNCTTAFDLAASQWLAKVVTPTVTVGTISGSGVGSGFTTTDPEANYVF